MDNHFTYRPMLDLIGRAEGTDPVAGNPRTARGYNETLGYGAFTNGPVDLVSMTLDEVDALQTAMLRHPNNIHNSSAVGRSQIIRTTLRSMRNTLGLSGKAYFDQAMQDRLTCFLLGRRGIDEWIEGRMTKADLINALAQEWASFPTTAGRGYYTGQRSRIAVAEVTNALDAVKARYERREAQSTPPAPQPPQTATQAPQASVAVGMTETPHNIASLAQRTPDELQTAMRMIALALAMQADWQITQPMPEPNFRQPLPHTQQEIPAMNGIKNIFQSKTIIGLAVAAITQFSPAVGGLLGLFVDVPTGNPAVLGDVQSALEQIITGASLLFAAWGRYVAEDKLTLTGK